VAIAIASALLAAVPAGAGGASSGQTSHAGTQAGAVKRATSARCSPRRIAALRTRRARAARRKSCRSGLHMTAKTPRRAAWPATASAPAAGGLPAPAAPAAPPAPGTPAPIASTLGANAYDIDGFVLRLTRGSVPAGNLTVFFHNYDVSDHDLWIEGPGSVLERISDRVAEGGGASRMVAVTPGAWRLFCSLPDHGAMTRGLTVTP